jgi:hypothetical protein
MEVTNDELFTGGGLVEKSFEDIRAELRRRANIDDKH